MIVDSKIASDHLDEGQLGDAPPPFHDATPPSPQPVFDIFGAVEGLPPEFSPYPADYFEIGYGDIVSHDPHLNSDGEALYRFLLTQAEKPPLLLLHCRGTHTEHHTRWVTNNGHDGHAQNRAETYTETVTDFDFYIDANPRRPGRTRAVQWSVADDVPAYRGLMVREVGNGLTGTRVAKSSENKTEDKWREERKALGLAPWCSGSDDRWFGAPEGTTLRSSKSVRQWADEYCASPKYLKEFVYKKTVYGWNLQALETAIKVFIVSAGYHGDLSVQFELRETKIYVRPDNRLSRMLSNKWLKFLSIILLIFPFIWLFKRFHPHGGGRWEVCGGGYALKRCIPAGEEDFSIGAGSSHLGGRTEGVKEGEWLRKWEAAIQRAVFGHLQSSIPLSEHQLQMWA